MTLAYVFFSHVFWPVFVPIAVLFIEPPGPRRRALAVLVGIGAMVSGWLLEQSLVHGVTSSPVAQHMEYVTPHPFAVLSTAFYVLATGASLLLSSHRTVKLFGILTLLSFVAAYAFYTRWFVSVWCYFAALLSGVVLLHFKTRLRCKASFAPL
jgi:hypothetical protein